MISIECRGAVNFVADQISEIDADRASQQEVVGAALVEMQADCLIGIDPNNLASTQSVLTGLSILSESGTACRTRFSIATSAPCRLMLTRVAPTLRRPSAVSNSMLDRFLTASQRGEALRSFGFGFIDPP